MAVGSNLFLSAVNKTALNMTRTENGALANSSTGSACLDMFTQMGNWQTLDEARFEKMFHAAWTEDKLIALRLLFNCRDARHGMKVKKYLQYLIATYSKKSSENIEFKDWLTNNLHLIPEFGYWKDMYSFHGTELWDTIVDYWCKTIVEDFERIQTPSSAPISLAAKYAPSDTENSTLANDLYKRDFIGRFVHPKMYRFVLSSLRTHLNIVEKQMSQRNWDQIEYSHVPSVAFLNYRKAFARHDPERFAEFLQSDKKVNAQVLTPVTICKQYYKETSVQAALEKLWVNLDDVFKGLEGASFLPICDCSGSMGSLLYGNDKAIQPIDVATALTIYCAERNKGPFQNLFMEFSARAKFYKLPTGTLFEKIKFIASHGDTANTNLQSVFDLILLTATTHNVPQDEMPNSLIIFTDGQFDIACAKNDKRNLDVIKNKFANAGYQCPTIVFWNLNSYENVPATRDDNFVKLVSGYSEQMLRYVMSNEPMPTPYDLMMKVVNDERYAVITI